MKRIHGHTGKKWHFVSPTYRSWNAMKQRCQDKNHPAFYRYGGRGITVCERWQKFINFLEDMGERPEGKSVDRIDNNKGYCKENCRWATPKEQCNNTRNNIKNIYIVYRGERKSVVEWEKITGIDNVKIRNRIKKGWYIGEVLGFLDRYPKCEDISIPLKLSRNEKIVFLKGVGCKLNKIGNYFGISRERARQIFLRQTNP